MDGAKDECRREKTQGEKEQERERFKLKMKERRRTDVRETLLEKPDPVCSSLITWFLQQGRAKERKFGVVC